jgi:hypothetical protein
MAEALADVCERLSSSEIARRCGRASTTIMRREADLAAYPAEDFLVLAKDDEALGQAVVDYVRGEAPAAASGQALSLAHHLLGELASGGSVSTRIAEAMADQRIDREERAKIREAIMLNRAREDQVLADMTAADEAGVP